jgi:hypothetical protein
MDDAFTFMPGEGLRLRAPPAGPPISIAHCSASPWALSAISRIQLWGLVHWSHDDAFQGRRLLRIEHGEE